MRSLREAIPRLADLLEHLDAAVQNGSISTNDAFVVECRRRWDDELMRHVSSVIPHWSTMASYADGKTLWHINIAMVALLQLDEYLAADEHDRQLLEWTVLLHDIAKEPTPQRRDHRHGFRSAALAAKYLPILGFATTEAYDQDFASWFERADAAHHYDAAAGEPIQDNSQLAAIIEGADLMLGQDGARVTKAIAMHQSVTVLADWPSMSPLTEDQERAFITPEVAALQLPLVLADSGGWNLFDPGTLAAMYAETRALFAGIAARRS